LLIERAELQSGFQPLGMRRGHAHRQTAIPIVKPSLKQTHRALTRRSSGFGQSCVSTSPGGNHAGPGKPASGLELLKMAKGTAGRFISDGLENHSVDEAGEKAVSAHGQSPFTGALYDHRGDTSIPYGVTHCLLRSPAQIGGGRIVRHKPVKRNLKAPHRWLPGM